MVEVSAASSAPIEIPQAQEGFICVGGSAAGERCAGNASTVSAEITEFVCPGGGSCVMSGGVGGGIAASWTFGAILGVFVVAGMSAIAIGMKLSADHRRKKRAKESSQKERQKSDKNFLEKGNDSA